MRKDMNKIITAEFLEVDYNKPKPDCVLYLPLNTSHFSMAVIMANNSAFDSYVYYEGELNSNANDYEKLKKIENVVTLAAFMPIFSKIVVFIPHVNINAPKAYNKILQIALENRVSIYEVPHGLFQSGYNLKDNSTIIDITSYYNGIGINLPSITKKRACWYGDNGIGYPDTINKNILKNNVLPNFILISTNTNWFLFSMEDKRNFFKLVFEFANSHPEKMFIWSPHPAEMNTDTYTSAISNSLPPNIHIYGANKDIYFNGIENTNDLIPYCTSGITTLSTCILNYEIHNKRVNLFNCEGVASLIATLKTVSTFTELDEIQLNPAEIESGYLKNYNPEIFDQFLSEPVEEDDMIHASYLTAFL